MSDQIDAVVRIDTQVTKAGDLDKLVKDLQTILNKANLIGEGFKKMDKELRSLDTGLQVIQKLDMVSQGTVRDAATRAAGKKITTKEKSDPDYVLAKINNDRLNIQKQIAKSASDVLAIARATQNNDQKSVDLIHLKNLELQQTVALQSALNRNKGTTEIARLQQEVLLTQDKIDAIKKAQVLEAKPVKTPESKEPDYLKRFKAHGGADILMIQARILAGYKILQGAYQSVGFVSKFIVDFDASLTNLQAVTQTTNSGMTTLRNTLIDVSKNSKFSAVELSDAALTMAQAGLSTDQIRQSIGAVSTLATAAGTDLATAVDVVTSAMNVFSLQASNTTTIANQMTAALNESKLNMTQLQLAIQYASNIAADSNIPFSEMIASFGAIADAGIRSGSSIGTGYRQLIQDLKDPSEKLITRLAQLGLGLQDIDVSAKGLTGVLKTLGDAGFTTSDAMRTMEIRGASIFSALSGNLDSAEQMRKAILVANDAVKAQEIQMNSLANIGSNLASVYGSLAANAFAPMVTALKALGRALADVGKMMGEYPKTTQVIVTAFTALIGGGILVWAAKLVVNFVGLTKVFSTLTAAAVLLKKGFIAVQAVGLITFLNPLGIVLSILTGSVMAGVAAWYALSGSQEKAKRSADEVQTQLDKAKGKVDQYSQAVDEASNFLDQLASRATELRSDQSSLNMVLLEAQQKFNGLTEVVFNTTDAYDQLVQKVRQVQSLNFDKKIEALQAQALASTANIDIKKQAVEEARQKALETVDTIRNGKSGGFTQFGMFGNSSSGPKEVQPFVTALENLLKKQNNPNIKDDLSRLKGRVGTAAIAAAERPNNTEVNDAFKSLIASIDNVRNSTEDYSVSIIKSKQDLANAKAAPATKTLIEANLPAVTAISKAIVDERAKLANKDGTLSLSERDKSVKLIDSKNKELEALMKSIQSKAGGKEAVTQLQIPSTLETNVKFVLERTQAISAENQRLTSLSIEQNKATFDKLVQKLGSTDTNPSAAQMAELKKLRLDIAEQEAANKIAASKDATMNSVIASGGSKAQGEAAQKEDAIRIRNTELDNAQADLDRVLNKQGQHVRQFDEDTLTPLETAMTRFKDNVAKANLDFENQKYQAEAPRRALEAKQAAQNSFENQGKVTDSQKELTQRALDRLETEQMKASLTPMLVLADNLQQQIATARAELDAAKNDQAQYAAAAAAASDNDVRGNLKKKADRAASSAQQLGSEILGTTKQLDDLQRQIAELKLQLGERSKTQEPSGFGETVSDWLRNMKEKLTGGDSFFKQIDSGLTQTFNSANSSLATMIKDTVTGTKSMKDAFRDFGISVVDTMMNVAAQMAANSILSSLLGSAASAFLPGVTSSVATPNATAGTFNYNLNGVGFSAGGMVGGGVPGKDSVPALLMPGEFVIKRSAVQALGAETLHQLNNGVRSAANANSSVAGRAPSNSGSSGTPVNIYIVDKGSVPALGPNDVIAMVSDNISRGGQIKQLIKQVVVA